MRILGTAPATNASVLEQIVRRALVVKHKLSYSGDIMVSWEEPDIMLGMVDPRWIDRVK